MDDLRLAGATVPGGGTLWWVNVNQTDCAGSPFTGCRTGTGAKIRRKVVSRQYPAWYPAACPAAAIGGQETMFCSGTGPPVIECKARKLASPLLTQ